MPDDDPATEQPEEWLGLVDYPGYEVSSLGRVRSSRTTQRTMRETPRPLKQRSLTDRYLRVTMPRQRERRRHDSVHVHALVLLAFVGKRPEGMVCRHLDGDCTNNNITNLRWGTQKENWADTVKHGNSHRTKVRGEAHSDAKLTESQVREIRQRYTYGRGTNALAREFGIHRNHVLYLASGKGGSHLT